MKHSMLPAVAGAIAASTPDLLLRQHPDTGEWAWKRTGMPWVGRFATKADACANAEACGMPKPYRAKVVPFEL